MSYLITTHGSAKSGYDRKVRAIASQYRDAECSLETLRTNIAGDIDMIKRANTAVASACYSVVVADRYEVTERIEIWNNVVPGKERLTVTIHQKP